MIAKGTFEITMSADPPYDVVDGVSLGKVHFDKRFSGPLEATSVVAMLGVRTPVKSSAGYVAIERVTGALDGKRGTFVLQHSGTMNRGQLSLVVSVVPDSGTGELAGLSGQMRIDVEGGQHFYTLDYELSAAPPG